MVPEEGTGRGGACGGEAGGLHEAMEADGRRLRRRPWELPAAREGRDGAGGRGWRSRGRQVGVV